MFLEKRKVTYICTLTFLHRLVILMITSNLIPSPHLSNRTKLVKKKKIMDHYDDYIQLKNESKVQSEISALLMSLTS